MPGLSPGIFSGEGWRVNRLICYSVSVVLLGPETHMNLPFSQPSRLERANGAVTVGLLLAAARTPPVKAREVRHG